MKIIIISPYPLPGASIHGGVESVTYNLVAGFKTTLDTDIRVLSFMHSGDAIIQEAPNIVVKYFRKHHNNQKIELLTFAKKILLKECKDWNPDIIHIEGNGSSLLLFDKKLKGQLVVTQHGILSKERNCYKSLRTRINFKIAEIIENSVKWHIRNWIFISKYNQALNRELINSKISWAQIYNPVNPKYFIDTRNDKNDFYFIGRLTVRKGIKDALIAYGESSTNSKFDFIGCFDSISYEKEINEIIEQYNIKDKVDFHGWKNSDEIIELVSRSRFLILASYQETLPVVISEAMAMGKVVIATNIGGIPEMVVDGETGFLFEPGDTNALAAIIRKVCLMPDNLLIKMSMSAKQRAIKLFSPDLIAMQTFAFYAEISGQ